MSPSFVKKVKSSNNIARMRKQKMHTEIWWENLLEYDYNNKTDLKVNFKRTNCEFQTWKEVIRDRVR